METFKIMKRYGIKPYQCNPMEYITTKLHPLQVYFIEKEIDSSTLEVMSNSTLRHGSTLKHMIFSSTIGPQKLSTIEDMNWFLTSYRKVMC